MRIIGMMVMVIGMVLLMSTGANAGPVGSAVDAAVLRDGIFSSGRVAFVLGLEEDWVVDRGLQNQNYDTELSFSGFKLGLLIRDVGLIYGLIGIGNIETEEIETDDNIYWGGGASFVPFQYKITDEDWFRIGIDMKYRGMSVDINSISLVMDDMKYSIPTDSSTWDYHEWQVAVVTSFQLHAAILYAGCKYSDVSGDASIKVRTQDYDLLFGFDNKSDENEGYFIGVSFDLKQLATFTFEARFLDEQAWTIGGIIRF